MGGDDQGAVPEPVAQPLDEFPLGVLVQRGGGFIHQHDIRIAQQHSRQQNRLALPAGESHAVFHDRVVQPLGQLLHEARRAGQLQRLEDLFVGGARHAEGDVLAQGAVKQPRVLGHKADVAPHVRHVEMRQAEAVEPQLARRQIHPARHRLQQGRFARAVAPEDRHFLTRPDLEAVNAQRHARIVRLIAELRLLEEVVAAQHVLADRRLLALVFGGKLHDAVQPLFCRFDLLPAGQHAAQRRHRGDHAGGQHRGGDHRAGGQGAVDHHRRADHNHGGVNQALDGHPPADQVLRQLAGAQAGFGGDLDIAVPLLQKAVFRLHQLDVLQPLHALHQHRVAQG